MPLIIESIGGIEGDRTPDLTAGSLATPAPSSDTEFHHSLTEHVRLTAQATS